MARARVTTPVATVSGRGVFRPAPSLQAIGVSPVTPVGTNRMEAPAPPFDSAESPTAYPSPLPGSHKAAAGVNNLTTALAPPAGRRYKGGANDGRRHGGPGGGQ